MVAIIHNSSSIKNVLHYNENKVRQKTAFFIYAGNYPKDAALLGFTDKLNRLEKLAALNQRTKINNVHISLNFDSTDKLDTGKLKDIAEVYMQKIGFGEQPFLVYQQHDAGHPHIHIVATNIQSDGNRISLHNLARNQSMQASKEIEKEFGLINAANKLNLDYALKPVNVQKAQYGKTETRKAIASVLQHVLPVYKYASLAELNAVLQQYNIIADRGSENSRVYQSKGLVYRIIDANKQKVGVPIKASLISGKPILKNIEVNFKRNELERHRFKRRVMNAVDLLLLKKENFSLPDLVKALQQENIRVVLRQNDDGIVYGITYVDHTTKCVFNGSHLGKQYSVNAILQRCKNKQTINRTSAESIQSFHQGKRGAQTPPDFNGKDVNTSLLLKSTNLLDDLMQPEENRNANEPFEQKKFKRKRKRKQQQSHN